MGFGEQEIFSLARQLLWPVGLMGQIMANTDPMFCQGSAGSLRRLLLLNQEVVGQTGQWISPNFTVLPKGGSTTPLLRIDSESITSRLMSCR